MVPASRKDCGGFGSVQEEPLVTGIAPALVALSVLCAITGVGCLVLLHCKTPLLNACGRWLSASVLVGLALDGLLAARHLPEALAPVGLLSGLLVVAMLWETSPAELGTRTTAP
jgi:hypothetical protein